MVDPLLEDRSVFRQIDKETNQFTMIYREGREGTTLLAKNGAGDGA